MKCINPIHKQKNKPDARLGTQFCLSCLDNRGIEWREREGGRVGRVSSESDTYSNEGIMNLYLEETQIKT